MSSRALAAIVVLLGVVLSPTRAVAAVRVLIAYDVAARPSFTARIEAGPSVRAERRGFDSYAYDDRANGYWGAMNSPSVRDAVALHAYDDAVNLADSREVGEPAIYDGHVATTAAEGVEAAEGAAQGASFGSFSSFKNALGPAGEGAQWHHIVEQTPGNLPRFGPGPIQNTGNLVRLGVPTHRQISGFYSSIQPFTGGATVRSWLSTQPFEIQQQFGQEVLLRFGVSF